MNHILTDIETKFGKSNEIIINGIKWLEITNYDYQLCVSDIRELLKMNIEANNDLDIEERADIIHFFLTFDFSDINTRQAVFQPKYKEDNTKAGCISCLQVLIREGNIELFVHVRSQNIKSNFLFDNQTYSMIINMLAEKLDLSIMKVYVKIVSLHKRK